MKNYIVTHNKTYFLRNQKYLYELNFSSKIPKESIAVSCKLEVKEEGALQWNIEHIWKTIKEIDHECNMDELEPELQMYIKNQIQTKQEQYQELYDRKFTPDDIIRTTYSDYKNDGLHIKIRCEVQFRFVQEPFLFAIRKCIVCKEGYRNCKFDYPHTKVNEQVESTFLLSENEAYFQSLITHDNLEKKIRLYTLF